MRYLISHVSTHFSAGLHFAGCGAHRMRQDKPLLQLVASVSKRMEELMLEEQDEARYVDFVALSNAQRAMWYREREGPLG